MRIVTVVPAIPIVSPEAMMPVPADIEIARRANQEMFVRRQTHRVWPSDLPAQIETYDGDPAATIAALARESNAALIVSGLGRHRVIDRVFGNETALRLVRVSSTPVLAVAPGLDHAPHRVVVAIDFSETSLRAARLSLELAAHNAVVYLAHVAPRDSTSYDWNGLGASYRDDAGYALQKIHDQLHVPDGITVQRVMLHGDPATELLSFATNVRADMIASGSHGHGFVARMLIGSVTTRMLRCSTCSVLSVPHLAAMTGVRTTAEPPVVTAIPRGQWSTQLDTFTRRNAGRRGVLEVDDPEIGAQAQENDYPLLGAAFDAHGERVELMLGELGTGRRHLTRDIGGVTGIDVLRDDTGRDVALRVAHGAGQTLLTFAP
jgi:nucleotide-binding universal stress UspA family protein